MHIFSIIYTLATVLCLANYAAADNNRWILSKNSLSNPKLRRQAVDILAEQNRDSKANAWQKAQRLGWNPRGQADGVYFELMLLVNGRPIYYTTQNVNAAISTAADLVRNTAPYNVNGNGFIVGVWDAGGVLQTHQEFDSRVRIMDGTGSHWHSTHVGGTIAASGVNNAALGMAPGATIDSYDWDSADSEMTSSAASYPQEPNKIYLSNHSYGIATGWSIGSYSGSYGYHWFGFWPVREDEGFGQYSSQAADWDSICYSAPYYLPFKSAGNDRGDYAPSNGTTFYYYDDGWKSKQYDSSTDPYDDGWDNGGFDTIPHRGNAKNIMTVGAVSDAVRFGERSVYEAFMTSFSSWGPTDDGRIKPDIVANGTDLYSTIDDSDTSYDTLSGTSMAAPNASGSATLLIQLYCQLFPGQAMLASTLKALIIHTADDMGKPGPDYSFGWGLMNTKAAADIIIEQNKYYDEPVIIEGLLNIANPNDSYSFIWNGDTSIRATLCWTDPPATALTGLDNTSPRLINDLGLRITGPNGVGVFYPFVLDPANPVNPAITGDNVLDNVEQVYIDSPNTPGIYTIYVQHKGTLTDNEQDYSLIVTGRHHTPDSKGTIKLDKQTYSCSDIVEVELQDGDIRNSGAHDVSVYTSSSDYETLTLYEQTFRKGIFKGTISTSSETPSIEDGTLQVAHGQTIIVTYQDANDGSGNPSEPNDSATIDCEPPTVFNIQMLNITSSAATLVFETNEPATAEVTYGLLCEEPNVFLEDPVLSTEHSFLFTNLVPETDYYFTIIAADSVGNETIDDNSGLCHQFTTNPEPTGIRVPQDYGTIQAAINAAADGNTIIVADGTYTGSGNRNIDFNGKSITVKSENGPANCIIDCQDSSSSPRRGFNFHSSEDANSIVSGFTIINGFGPEAELRGELGPVYYPAAGAILCKDSSPTIEDCIFRYNEADRTDYGRGGAVVCSSSNAVIYNCTFEENEAHFGGGLYVEGARPTITDCKFTNNTSSGGGALKTYGGSPLIQCCTFNDNLSDSYGGAIHCQEGGANITNCVVFNNTAYNSGMGVGMGGGIHLEPNPHDHMTMTNCTVVYNTSESGAGGINSGVVGSAEITNCIVWANSSPQLNLHDIATVTYCDIMGGFSGEGNINIDPNFVSQTDYHLTAGSACIDAGTNEVLTGFPPRDIEGRPRPLDGDANQTYITDMGAYEFWTPPAMPFIAIDRTKLPFTIHDTNIPLQKSFFVRNGWAGTLHWQITENCPWLDVQPISGASTGDANEVMVTVDAAGLSDGIYIYQLNVSDQNAVNNPQTLWVELHVGKLHVPADYPTMGQAIEHAFDGDIIVVADGIYNGPENRDMTIKNKQFIIMSENGPKNCIIDCQNNGRAFYIRSPQASGTTIRGLTIKNGSAEKGGAFSCEYSSPIIENCRITNCAAGSGLYFAYDCNPIIKNCVISGNHGSKGGSIQGYKNCNLKIVNCLITDNHASNGGGAIFCSMDCSCSLINSTIANNTADEGGGAILIHTPSDSLYVANCILWGDSPDEITQSPGLVDVVYSDIQGGFVGEGNIEQNPLFTSSNDYHLLFGSPCIDSGTNNPVDGLPGNDLDYNPRLIDGDFDDVPVVDMGAYELNRDPNSPVLAASPSYFEFDVSASDPNPPPRTLSIWNAGAGILNWQISKDCNWLQITPLAGQSSGDVNEVTIDVNTQGLTFGQYLSTLTIFDPCDPNNIRPIPVTLTVDLKMYVPADYPTIQDAIDAAFEGCEIIVADGIYTGQGNRDIDFKGKAITIRSKNGPQNCIIDCQGSPSDSHRGFYFHSFEGPDSVVDGFTITNGYFTQGSRPEGGAILCFDNTNTRPTFRNCIITGNSAHRGGAVSCNYVPGPTFINCIFYGNNAVRDRGGAVFCWSLGGMKFYNCTITNNNAVYEGDAISIFNASMEIKNSIIWGNGDSEFYVGGNFSLNITYSDIKGGFSGTGNINVDPLFVDPGNNDFHIQRNSPCVNSGDPDYVPDVNETDFDGGPRLIAGRIDMGADEVSEKQTDFTGNGLVYIEDLDILAQAWLSQTGSPNWNINCDLVTDGWITFRDFAEFANDWLWQADWYVP